MTEAERHKFEFAVILVVVAVLAGVLMQALERTRTDFEEAAVQSDIAALRIELLDRLSHHEAVGGSLPVGVNPVEWSGYRPRGYLGERDEPPAETGAWYFDRRVGELVYRYRSGREARLRLTRGGGNAAGTLTGIGLQRVDNVK